MFTLAIGSFPRSFSRFSCPTSNIRSTKTTLGSRMIGLMTFLKLENWTSNFSNNAHKLAISVFRKETANRDNLLVFCGLKFQNFFCLKENMIRNSLRYDSGYKNNKPLKYDDFATPVLIWKIFNELSGLMFTNTFWQLSFLTV